MFVFRRTLAVTLPMFLLVVLAHGVTWTSIDFPGSAETYGRGVNSSGDVVGFFFDGHQYHGFLFQSGIYSAIDFPGSTGTVVDGVNDSDDVVGQYVDNNRGRHGFVTVGGTFVTLDPPGSTSAEAFGINSAGLVAGTFQTSDGVHHGFKYVNGTFTIIDLPGKFDTQIFGVDSAGDFVGLYNTTRAYAFIEGVLHPLRYPDTQTKIFGINDHRKLAGSVETRAVKAFVFTSGEFVLMNVPGQGSGRGSYAEAYGIDNNGDVVGTYQSDDLGIHGFLRQK